ncbi:MAG TPA: hypothetical protein PLV37_03095 [Bacillota bacterium]|jgi:hypothetical protein|nr:hypothetical protein [Bacillota bacterium]
MKKKIALILVLVLAVFAFTACGGGSVTPPEDDGTDVPAAGAVKTGYAVVTSAAKSVDADEKNGTAQADSTVVAVTVDENGIITNCVIDHAQTKIEISKDGKIVTPLDTVIPGKQELGEAYGMKKASSIGKEWNEQATALSNYVIGKTVSEVKGIAVNEKGAPADSDLASSVTVSIGGYVAAIEKAVANAEDMGASADDRLGVGIVTTIDKSKDAGDEEGLAQAYTNYAVVTFDKAGVITSCIIDASQTNINFTKEGKITTDLTAEVKTKNELGAAYGMIKASSIGKEWNEQAAAFAAYVVGKTADEVKGIALTEDGVAADADLSASVTVHIGPFMNNVAKAFDLAK